MSMNEGPITVTGARDVLFDLNKSMSHTVRYQREIRVSFRDSGGAVGRRDFATHMIHWYPAKMFHRIPSVFLDTVDLPTQATILDPFCGSGTVLLEANLRGHKAVGIDINPLARLISRVKVTPIEPGELQSHLTVLLKIAKNSKSMPTPQPILDYWLSSPARIGLHRLLGAIGNVTDAETRAFFIVTLTSIVRRVSLADPAIPPLVRLREDRALVAGPRYLNSLQRSRSVTISSVYSAFAAAAKANIRRVSELDTLQQGGTNRTFSVLDGEAAQTGLKPESVDAIITSPPYCGAQKYVRSMKLELILSGCPQEELRELDRQTLGTEAVTQRNTRLIDLLTEEPYIDRVVRAIYEMNPVRARMASDYCKYLSAFAYECQRILRPGAHLLVTLGRSTLAGLPFQADHIFRHASQAAGLEFVATLVDRIPSRGLLTQRHSTAGRIDHEFIVWLRRPHTKQPMCTDASNAV